MNELRTCGYDSRFWLGYATRSMGGMFLCPQHMAAMFGGHNPQPYRVQQATGREAQQQVRLIDGSQRAYVVLERVDDLLTLRPMGTPDAPSFTASVATTYPAFGDVFGAISRGLELAKKAARHGR